MAKGADEYGSFGSVPTDVAQGGFTPNMQVKASPESMGAGIGQAVTQAADKVQEYALKQQGMQMETLATNADAAFTGKMGDIRGRYKSLTGMEAVNAKPQFLKEIEDARIEARKSLPPLAARAFDGMAMRTYGYGIGEVHEYAAAQGKEAFNAAGSNLIASQALAAGDPSIAMNDRRFGEVLGDIQHGAGMLIDPDHPGLKKDENGQIAGFNEESPEGQVLKSTHQNILDFNVGEAYKNRYKTLAAQDPIAADAKFQAEKKNIPPLAAVAIEASLAPKVAFAQSKNLADVSMVKANQAHAEFLLNPPTAGTSTNKTADDIANAIYKHESASGKITKTSAKNAIGPMQITPDTWNTWKNLGLVKAGEKIDNQVDNKNVGFRAVNYYNDLYKDDPDRVAKVAIAYQSGPNNVAQKGDKTPWKNNPTDGNQHVSEYVGAINGLLGIKSAEAAELPEAPVKEIQARPYATNPSGSPVSQTDYQLAHRDEILQHAAAEAERLYPGNLAVAQKSRALILQHISDNAQSQSAEYKQDRMLVQRAINGEFTNGKTPSYDELTAMPQVGEALQRAEVNSPDYTKGIDAQIAARSRGSNKDVANFGSEHLNLLKKINSGEITDPTELVQYMDDDAKVLTTAGYNDLESMIKTKHASPMGGEDVKDLTAGFSYIKNMFATPLHQSFQGPDLSQEALMLEATPRLRAWVDLHKKEATIGEMSAPKNKLWMGNAIPDLIKSHTQAITDATMAGVTPISIEDQRKAVMLKYNATMFPEIKQQILDDAVRKGLFAPKVHVNTEVPISE
jgi:hypothetical protein